MDKSNDGLDVVFVCNEDETVVVLLFERLDEDDEQASVVGFMCNESSGHTKQLSDGWFVNELQPENSLAWEFGVATHSITR